MAKGSKKGKGKSERVEEFEIVTQNTEKYNDFENIHRVNLSKYEYREKPEKFISEKSFNDLIIKSILADDNDQQQALNIINAFNHHKIQNHRPSFFVNGRLTGRLIARDEFSIAIVNGEAQMTGYTEIPQRRRHFRPRIGVQIERKGPFKHTEQYFHGGGIHVINVPDGKIAKVRLSGENRPAFLGAGPWVIPTN